MIHRTLIRIRCLALLLSASLYGQTGFAGLVPSMEDVVFLVDNSHGMLQVNDALALPASISTFLPGISRDVTAALILFDDTVTLAVPFTPVSGERANPMQAGLEDIDYHGRYSNSAAALERALYELGHNRRKGAGKSIVLITTGAIHTGDSADDLNFTQWLASVLTEDAVEAQVRVFCIAFSASGDVPLLADLAQKTGGHYYRYAGERDLSSVFDRLAVDLFSEPTPAQSGKPLPGLSPSMQ